MHPERLRDLEGGQEPCERLHVEDGVPMDTNRYIESHEYRHDPLAGRSNPHPRAIPREGAGGGLPSVGTSRWPGGHHDSDRVAT